MGRVAVSRRGSGVALAVVAVALGIVACAGRKPAPGATSALGPANACPAGDVTALDAELSEGETVLTASGPDGGTLPARRIADVARPRFQGRVLLPPGEVGASDFEVMGCLAMDVRTEAGGERYPAQLPDETGIPKKVDVRLTPVFGGVIVLHELSHPCCLKAEVESRLEGSTLIVTERLGGTPCRCQCASSVRTAVGLQPGKYTLVLNVDERGALREAARTDFELE